MMSAIADFWSNMLDGEELRASATGNEAALIEVKAKREVCAAWRLIDDDPGRDSNMLKSAAWDIFFRGAVRPMLQPYRDHMDFDPDWRLEGREEALAEFEPSLADDEVERLEGDDAASMFTDFGMAIAENAELRASRDRMALEIAEIRGSLHEVRTFEGIVDGSPTAIMVSELVRDHEALEARIENALLLCADKESVDAEAVIHLLRGGSPIDDDASAIDEFDG